MKQVDNQITSTFTAMASTPGTSVTIGSHNAVADGTYQYSYNQTTGVSITFNGAPVTGTVAAPFYLIVAGDQSYLGCTLNDVACTVESNGNGNFQNVTTVVTVISNRNLSYYGTTSMNWVPNENAPVYDPSNLASVLPKVLANEDGHAIYQIGDATGAPSGQTVMGPLSKASPTAPTACDELHMQQVTGHGMNPSCPQPPSGGGSGGGSGSGGGGGGAGSSCLDPLADCPTGGDRVMSLDPTPTNPPIMVNDSPTR